MSPVTRTRRTRRLRRPRRDKPPALQTMSLGLLVVAVTAIAGYLLLSVYNGVPGRSYRTAYVSVPTVGNLLAHDAVRISGKRVGQVLHLDVGHDGRPRVELQLEPGIKLPSDTKVAIRASGLLGSRYVDLRPGTATTALADGAAISGGANTYTYGLPEAVAVFDKQARGGLQKTVAGLAAGLTANGAPLNVALKDLRTAPAEFDAVARSVLARQGAAARLVPSLASAVTPLDRVRGAAAPFLQGAIDTLRPLATERTALEDTLAQTPATLDAATTGLRHGRTLLTSVRTLATAADGTLPQAPAGLTQLAALLRDGQAPIRRALPTVRDLLAPTANNARKALVATEPVVPHIKSGIDTARPILGTVGRYSCDVVNTGAVLRSMTGFAQAGSGPAGRLMAFRLQAIIPAGLEAVGIKDETGIYKRDGNEAPCKYLARPYPQLIPGGPISSSAPTRSPDR
jgi:phospholipid/cholesterol/gamma-HCH transport system substrate-binding protein